jgi:hypothetical protein
VSKSQPSILKRLVGQLKAKGKSDKAAHAIAISALRKSGNLKKGSTEPTAKGKRRGKMTAGERAKDRAAKLSGRKTSEYKYNQRNNTARLKKRGD